MRAYAKGIVDLFCEMTETVKEKLRAVTAPCLPESNMTDEELAKPDIAFAVQRLASHVTRWTRWEDRQTFRLISYLRAASEHVMKLKVDPNQLPSLSVNTDSDFA
eukprot:s2861_g19.t1